MKKKNIHQKQRFQRLLSILQKSTFLCCIGLTAWITACTSETDGIGQDSTAVVLRPIFVAASPETRSIVNGLGTAGGMINQIKLYVTKSDGYTPYPGIGSSPNEGLSTYTGTGNGTLIWEGSPVVKLHNETARIFAYAPADAALTKSGNSIAHTIPVTVESDIKFDGSSEWNCTGDDYLYGSSSPQVGVSAEITASNADGKFSPTIHLQHALAQVAFKLQTANGRPVDGNYDYVKSIKLEATDAFLAGTGTMQIADGAISGIGAASTLTFTPSANPKICGNYYSGNIVAYGLVAPINNMPSSVTLTITLGSKDNDTHKRVLTVTSDNFKVQWEKGKRYIYNLTLTDRAIEVSGVEIKEWGAKVSGTGDLEPDLTK